MKLSLTRILAQYLLYLYFMKKFVHLIWILLLLHSNLGLGQSSINSPETERTKLNRYFADPISIFFGIPPEYLVQTEKHLQLPTWAHKEFLSMAQGIQQSHPTERFHYIILGGSPTLIGIYLQILHGQGSVSYLPLNRDFYDAFSHKKQLVYVNDPKTEKEAFNRTRTTYGLQGRNYQMSAEERQTYNRLLGQHIDYFIDPQIILGKKLLVIDLIESGSALKSATDLLKRHYKLGEKSIQGFALYNTVGSIRKKYRQLFSIYHGYTRMKINPHLAEHFQYEFFDKYRRHQAFSPAEHTNIFTQQYKPPANNLKGFTSLYQEASLLITQGILAEVKPAKSRKATLSRAIRELSPTSKAVHPSSKNIKCNQLFSH